MNLFERRNKVYKFLRLAAVEMHELLVKDGKPHLLEQGSDGFEVRSRFLLFGRFNDNVDDFVLHTLREEKRGELFSS